MASPESTSTTFLAYAPYGTAIIAATVAVLAAFLNAMSGWRASAATKINADRALDVARINADHAIRVSHGAKIAEFREKWLGELRRDISDFVGAAERVLQKWEEINDLPAQTMGQIEEKDRRRLEELAPLSDSARVINWRILLRINPRDSATKKADDEFLRALEALWNPTLFDPAGGRAAWNKQAGHAIELGRELLKREWEVTKRFPVSPDLAAPLPGDRQRH